MRVFVLASPPKRSYIRSHEENARTIGDETRQRYHGSGKGHVADRLSKQFARRYQVSYEALTRMTGFSLRAVSNWSQGSKPSSSTARRLTEMQRLFTALENLVSPEAIGPWLKDPNPAFDGSTPLQVIERGESDRIWRMVYELESGEPA